MHVIKFKRYILNCVQLEFRMRMYVFYVNYLSFCRPSGVALFVTPFLFRPFCVALFASPFLVRPFCVALFATPFLESPFLVSPLLGGSQLSMKCIPATNCRDTQEIDCILAH